MKLKRLVIQGFKSFKDKTTIHFDNGITGIVGPNGCGKSNIVDALFWVMGEMSAKHLRGASMKDLIFSGSDKYKPGSFAQASLVLENIESKHIHIGNRVVAPSEIELTRKLYRNGETEYRINGEPCRLKDVQEVFMDTGAGAKSYSIIAQGEINRLVQAKPQERRTMIEEVAGVTKFKLRRRESLKKIEATQANIERLRDLKSEIDKNLKVLQKQAEKATRARTLKERVQRHELVVNSHKVYNFLKSHRDQKQKFKDNLVSIEQEQVDLNSRQEKLAHIKKLKGEFTSILDKLQDEIKTEAKDQATLEERLIYLKKSSEEKNQFQKNASEKVLKIEDEIKQRSESIQKLEASLKELLEDKIDKESLQQERNLLEQKKTLLNEKENKAKSYNQQKSQLEAKLLQVEKELVQNESKIQECSRILEDINVEREDLESRHSLFSKTFIEDKKKHDELKLKLEEIEEKEKESLASLNEKRSELDTHTKESSELEGSFISNKARLGSLLDLRASLEGSSKGAASFLKTKPGSAYQLLGNLIECEPKFTNALELVLDQFLKSVISSQSDEIVGELDQSCALSVLKFANNNQDDAFSNIDELKERLALSLGLSESKIFSLADIIKLKDAEGFQNLQKKFSRFFIIDLDAPSYSCLEKLSPDMGFEAVISLDGRCMVQNYGGAFQVLHVRSKQKRELGLVERNNLISNLELECQQLESKVEQSKSTLEKLSSEYDELKQAHHEIVQTLQDMKVEFSSAKRVIEEKENQAAQSESRLKLLSERQNKNSSERLRALENDEKIKNQKLSLEQEILSQQNEQDLISKDTGVLKEEISGLQASLSKKELVLQTFETKKQAFENQLIESQNSLSKDQENLSEQRELCDKYEREIKELLSNDKSYQKELESKRDQLSELEAKLKEQKVESDKLQREISEGDDFCQKKRSLIAKLEKENMEIEVSLSKYIAEEEQLTRNIFEKYQVNLRATLGQYLEYDEQDFSDFLAIDDLFASDDGELSERLAKPYEFIRKYGEDLKESEVKFRQYKSEYNRLGEINWQAIEEFDRQKARLDFLQSQELELLESVQDLENAINHIDEKSKKRFKEAFHEVNIRFEKVFPIIFGGGSAKLQLIGQIEDEDCGVEIVASPPGKKMQNINLMSGGEKALTAVSLIFSIFLVKPSPFCLLDEVDAPLDDANVGRFNELLREMSSDSQFILITHNKRTMELNDTLYGVTMQEPGVSSALSVQLQ